MDSIRWSFARKGHSRGADYSADSRLITDIELHFTFESKITLNDRARPNHNHRIFAVEHDSGRFIDHDPILYVGRAQDVDTAVNRFNAARYVRGVQSYFAVDIG